MPNKTRNRNKSKNQLSKGVRRNWVPVEHIVPFSLKEYDGAGLRKVSKDELIHAASYRGTFLIKI